MISKAYVFVDGLEAQPVICGVVQHDAEKGFGQFRYGQHYLARGDAFALDPLNLPLTDSPIATATYHGTFGVLNDAGPDSWGKRVILSLHNTQPQNPLEFLLAGSGMGVGALTFSLSRSACKPKYNKNHLSTLPLLYQASHDILKNNTITPEAKKLFEYGSSMGGARPKTTLSHQQKQYLVKLNAPSDLYNHVRAEHASMRMLAELGCTVANTQVHKTQNGDALLVERFDIADAQPTHHFISAHALLNRGVVNERLLRSHYSYGFIAEWLKAQGSEPLDAQELYTRMLFNALIGNTDDHARNHACLYSFQQQTWRLSPAYDVLPINSSKQHSLGLGEQGRIANVENLLSQSVRFGLKNFKAKRMLSQVQELVAEWPGYFRQHGVSDGDIATLEHVIPSLS